MCFWTGRGHPAAGRCVNVQPRCHLHAEPIQKHRAHSRRTRNALKPLLGHEHLSKSSVSRVVSRLKERFEEWKSRDLSDETYTIVFLDGFHLEVRMAKRVVSVPVLAALGVAPDGQRRLLSLCPAVSEASTHWSSLVEDLQARGLPAPKLVVSDGHKGLMKGFGEVARVPSPTLRSAQERPPPRALPRSCETRAQA